MMATFRCEAVRKSFGGIQALADIDLEFPPTGITALIGPNGAGKTTLLNVLTGFARPDSGRCFLGDHETTGLPPHRIARLGVARTFQDVRLVFQAPTVENVLLARPRQRGEGLLSALFLRGVAEEEHNRLEAMRLLESVG